VRPIQARVTPANPIAYVRLDQMHGAALAVQAMVEPASRESGRSGSSPGTYGLAASWAGAPSAFATSSSSGSFQIPGVGVTTALGGAAPTGPDTYQIDYSFEDPNDLVSPVALASMNWDNSLIPYVGQQGQANTTFVIPTAPLWARVQLLSGSTPVRFVFTQYEAHRSQMVAGMPHTQMLNLGT
jgi:hypothetical protein